MGGKMTENIIQKIRAKCVEVGWKNPPEEVIKQGYCPTLWTGGAYKKGTYNLGEGVIQVRLVESIISTKRLVIKTNSSALANLMDDEPAITKEIKIYKKLAKMLEKEDSRKKYLVLADKELLDPSKDYLPLPYGGIATNLIFGTKLTLPTYEQYQHMFHDIFTGLGLLHEKNIQHGDMQAENITYDAIDDTYKIIGFGRAEILLAKPVTPTVAETTEDPLFPSSDSSSGVSDINPDFERIFSSKLMKSAWGMVYSARKDDKTNAETMVPEHIRSHMRRDKTNGKEITNFEEFNKMLIQLKKGKTNIKKLLELEFFDDVRNRRRRLGETPTERRLRRLLGC